MDYGAALCGTVGSLVGVSGATVAGTVALAGPGAAANGIPIFALTTSDVFVSRRLAPKATTPLFSISASSSSIISLHVKPSKHAVYLCSRRLLSHAGTSSSRTGSTSSSFGVVPLDSVDRPPLLFKPLLLSPALLPPEFLELLSALPG